MMKSGKVALKIDSVRVYQSMDDDAHDGQPHSLGCDPVEFPTREYIKGYEYKYMRPAPFVINDKHPLKSVKNGGGMCKVDDDCGGGGAEDIVVDQDWTLPDLSVKKKSHGSKKSDDDVVDLDKEDSSGTVRENQSPLAHNSDSKNRRLENVDTSGGKGSSEEDEDPTAGLDRPPIAQESLVDNAGDTKVFSNPDRKPKGKCVTATLGMFGAPSSTGKQCKCNKGYTGPHCLSIDKFDDEKGALELKKVTSLFTDRVGPHVTSFHLFLGGIFVGAFLVMLGLTQSKKNNGVEMAPLRS